jgi:hypothetical protein
MQARVCVTTLWPRVIIWFEGAKEGMVVPWPTKTATMTLCKRTSSLLVAIFHLLPRMELRQHIVYRWLCFRYSNMIIRYSNITIRYSSITNITNITIRVFVMFELMIYSIITVMFELMMYFIITMVNRYSRSLHGYTSLECVRPPLHEEAMVERCLRHTAISAVIG